MSNFITGRSSYLPELTKKLDEGASPPEVQRLVSLEMVSIVAEQNRMLEALAPNQINLRAKETLRHLRRLGYQLKGLRELSRHLNQMHKRGEYINWQSRKFTYVVDQLVELAVQCLRTTSQSERTVQNWILHYTRQVEEKLENICRTADKL
jgi:DNA-binding transcriptional MerR regulator